MTQLLHGGLSALAAGLTAILSQLGVEGIYSTLMTTVRTVVVGSSDVDDRRGSPSSKH